MKTATTYRIDGPRRRDPYAREVLDRDGPYRPRRAAPKVQWSRRPKHRGQEFSRD